MTLVAALVTFVLLLAAHNRDIPKKWVTATMGTLGPFSFVIYAYRGRLLRLSFWASLAICLGVHIVVIWIFFQYVLISFQAFSIWLWFPVMLIEALPLLEVSYAAVTSGVEAGKQARSGECAAAFPIF